MDNGFMFGGKNHAGQGEGSEPYSANLLPPSPKQLKSSKIFW
jgi:hypothetical protein